MSPGEVKELIITSVQAEVKEANLQQLISHLQTTCFTRCSAKNGMDNICLDRCSEQFMKSWSLVSTCLVRRMSNK